ncbi:hypothetical protein LHYA1_G001063 [Lachnellula hyalina]|uniref:Nitrogen regulatory protein areA GATA-like domain-containing protein n=1 Tax=Lachnellula hyalina TaxID=1316788 RepID=A0A8H8R7U2_9HELO|nr:uncharacterized protein LHYA1_G001063 [Lachnellula hyalina]TVY30169.1 hypothetical protein LHYA1_G001063 [Lachnellula hyalina]
MSFVRNAPGIEGSIESMDIDPLDPADIARLWKVYTTTKRRLLDPTAERLENYWWRIWGSRKRELKGAMVARLFAQISDGHTFVPLRGPPNLDAAPPLERNNRFRSGASSATTLHQPAQSRPSTTSATIPRAPRAVPHPILKKTGGPSTSGPRPTARFVSPHESERETEPDSPVSTNSHVVVQPPSPDIESIKNDQKASVLPGLKKATSFVASSAAKKKRPVVVRRQSSQNSQSSTDAPQLSGSTQPPSQRTAPTTSEQAQARSKHSVPSKFQENFSPSNRSSASSSTQKHRVASKTSDSKRNLSHKTSAEKCLKLKKQEAEAGPSNRLRPVEHKQDEVEELTSSELEQLEIQRTLLEQANSSTEKPPRSPSTDQALLQQKSTKSRSDDDRSGDTGGLRMLSHNSKTTTSAAPTLTTANGQLDLKDPTMDKSGPNSVSTSSPSIDKGKGRDPDDTRRSFTKRLVQPATQPKSEPMGPLSRSKSQLTLLLEKDRSRGSGDQTSNDKKE